MPGAQRQLDRSICSASVEAMAMLAEAAVAEREVRDNSVTEDIPCPHVLIDQRLALKRRG